MEVAGLLLGLTGPFQQLIESINTLKARLKAYTTNYKEALSLHGTFDRLATNIGNLAQSLQDNTYSFPEENNTVLKEAVKTLGETVSSALEEVHELSNRLTSKSYRFRHAFRTQASFATLQASARRAESLILQICCTLANAAASGSHADRVIQTVRDCSSPHQASPSEDVFRLVVVVPDNPPYVVLDYDAKDDEGKPRTMESKLKAEILRKQPTSCVGAVATGTGGVGKSCALRGLAKQADIRTKFTGGIFHLSMGLNATTAILKQKICQLVEYSGGVALSHELRAETELEIVITRARLWFCGRPVLFLLDDIWQVNDIHSDILSIIAGLATADPSSRLAYTTRDQRLGLQGCTVQFNSRDERDSRTILLAIAGFVQPQLLVPSIYTAVENILSVCAGLPAALAIAGNNVRLWANLCRSQPAEAWPRYWSQLDAQRSQLLTSSSGGYDPLVLALSTSLEFLDDYRRPSLHFQTPLSFREMFRALSAIRKQTWVPEYVLQKLWDLPDTMITGQILKEMSSVSVIQTEMKTDGISPVAALEARLHDLHHDIASEEAAKSQEVSFWPEQLLSRYASDLGIHSEKSQSAQLRNWCSQKVLQDRFLQQNLSRLLMRSLHIDELLIVLCNPQWSIRRLETGQGASLQEDFELCLNSLRHIESSGDHDRHVRALKAILAAIRLSAGILSHNSQELYFQLSSRLMRVVTEMDLVREFLVKLKHATSFPYLESLTPCLAAPGGAVKSVIPLGAYPNCLAILDCGHVACGCDDGKVRLVDTERGLVVSEWRAFKNSVSFLDISKNRRRLVCGGADGNVNVWDIEKGLPTSLIFSACLKHLSSVAISPDGEHVVVGGDNGEWWDEISSGDSELPTAESSQVWAWDINRNDEITKPTVDKPFPVYHVSFSEDGALLLVLGEDKEGWISGFFRGRRTTRTFYLHGCYVFASPCGSWHGAKAACITPDGKFIFSESMQGCVSVLESSSGDRVFQPFSDRPWEKKPKVAGSSGAKRVAFVEGRVIRMWDVWSQTEIGDGLKGHSGEITDVKLTGRGEVVSCSYDGTLRIWDPEIQGSSQISEHQAPIISLSVAPRKQLVLSASEDRTACLWDLRTGVLLETIQLPSVDSWNCSEMAPFLSPLYFFQGTHSHCTEKVLLTSDGTHVVHLSSAGTVTCWDRNMNVGDKGAIQFCREGISCIAITEKDRLAMGSFTGDVRICCISHDGDERILMQDGGELAQKIAAREEYEVKHVDGLFLTEDSCRLVSVNILTRYVEREEAAEMFSEDEFISEYVSIRKYCVSLWDLDSYECVKAIEHGPFHQFQDNISFGEGLPQDLVMDLVDETFKESIAQRQLCVNGYSVEERDGLRRRKVGTMESTINCSAYSKEGDCIILGLDSGEVAFLRLVDGDERQS